MRIRRAMPVVVTDDPLAARRFYVDLLGFRIGMDEDGMLMLLSESTPTTQLIVAWPSPTAVDPDLISVGISIEVDDVDAAYAHAREAGWRIVRDIGDEPRGIRRFFVLDPTGRIVNVAGHIT